MNIQRIFLTGLILAAGAVLPGVFPAAAEVRPSSGLLLPWFEVDLEGGAHTTLFALANSSAEPVDVLVSVQTSWGIPMLDLTLTLAGGQTETVDLRDWLVLGRLPSGALGSLELAHVQAALSGRASSRDGLYYASPPAVPGRAVGSITFRAQGFPQKDVLWGDFILFDSERGSALAEGLVNLDSTSCTRHGLRFLTGHQAEMASELWLWTRLRGEPSVIPEVRGAGVIAEVFDEAGRRLATHHLELPPVARISLQDLAGNEPFGRIDLSSTGEESFAGVVVRDEHGMAMLLPAVCLPDLTGPRLRLDVLVNGEEAPVPPGPPLPAGETIDWRYAVTNTGDVPLSGILVSDARGIDVECPGDALAPGESMTCTATSIAVACQQEIAAEATAVTPDGAPIAAGGSACYFGGPYGTAAIDLETSIVGEDADVPPGPTLEAKDPLPTVIGWTTEWWYHVQNTGVLPLSSVTVSDEQAFNLYCPKDALAPGESMGCSQIAWPKLGLNHSLSKATGVTSCGLVAEDEDPTYYLGVEPKTAQIEIEAFVGGHEADTPPGPVILMGQPVLLTFVIVNTGEIRLFLVRAPIPGLPYEDSCFRRVLDPGEIMTCTRSVSASPGQQQVTVTVSGFTTLVSCGFPPNCTCCISDSDFVHYLGAAPSIDQEVSVNGEDADAHPGPEIPEGSPVEWTYTVTNKGNVDLTLVKILDEQGVEVAGCPVSYLTPGASASCSVTGEAAAGPQQRTATVTGTPFAGPVYPTGSWTGPPVTDSDDTWYTGVP